MKKTAVVTGVTGQDSSYLAELLLEKDYKVYGFKRRSSGGTLGNVAHLEGEIEIVEGDLLDYPSMLSLMKTAKPHEFYNLAAQSHVGASFKQPVYTLEATGKGVLHCLEAIRESGFHTKFYQASTSELFGGMPGTEPQSESTPFEPRSPYGCAKLYALHMTRIYRDAYRMFTCNGILYNHECFFADTPVILRRGREIDVSYVSSLVPGRKNVDKDTASRTAAFDGVEIWDGRSFVALKAVSRKKLNLLDEKNQKRRVTNARDGAVCTTPNHKLCGPHGEKSPADSFREGDALLTGRMPAAPRGKFVGRDFAKLLGLLAGDGYVASGSVRLTNNDPQVREEFKRLCLKVFCGISFRESTFTSGYGGTTTHLDISGLGGDYQGYLRGLLYDKKTSHKKVPALILNAGAKAQEAFLDGYNAADGLKADRCTYRYKSFKTNSALLGQGLLFLLKNVTGQSWNVNAFEQNGNLYYQVNLHSDSRIGQTGQHKRLPSYEVKKILQKEEENQHVYDIETETGVVMAGLGVLVVGNSPRRGPNFVTRKITMAVARIKAGLQDKLYLGNLDAKRDWGYAGDFVRGMHAMLQQSEPDDYVLATGETHTIREFCEAAFSHVELDYTKHVEVDPAFYRPCEVHVLLGDAGKAKRVLGWEPTVTFKQLAEMMVDSDMQVLAD